MITQDVVSGNRVGTMDDSSAGIDYRNVFRLLAKLKFDNGRPYSHCEIVLTDGTQHEVSATAMNDLAKAIRADKTRALLSLNLRGWDYQYEVAERQPDTEPQPATPGPYAAYGGRSYDWRRGSVRTFLAAIEVTDETL